MVAKPRKTLTAAGGGKGAALYQRARGAGKAAEAEALERLAGDIAEKNFAEVKIQCQQLGIAVEGRQ